MPAAVRPFERTCQARRHRGRGQSEIGGTNDLALAHRNAAQNLRQKFADPDLDQEFLDLAQRAGVMGALGEGRHLADAFDIGREPGEAVGGALLAVEQPLDGMGLDPDPAAHGSDGVAQDRFRGEVRLAGEREEFEPGISPGRLLQHLNPPRTHSLTDPDGR